MKKALIIAAVAVVAVGGSAIAYKAYARHDGWGHGRWHRQLSTSDMTAYADARIAALKAGLTLNAEQEKLWPPVEATLKDLAKKRIDRVEQFRAERKARREQAERSDQAQRPLVNPIERMRKGSERLAQGSADLKRLADATDPLYQSLDEAQKRRFNVLAQRGMRAMQRDDRGWQRRGEMGDEGRHFGSRDRSDRDQGWRRIDLDDDAPVAERI
jgi:hypothetical protein